MTRETWEAADFPAALRDRFTPRSVLDVGAESVVYLADSAAGTVVVKVDKEFPADLDQMLVLARRGSARHVPRIYGYGNVEHDGGTVGWTAEEYCVHGSLRDVIHGAAPPAGDRELHAIVAELAECLHFWLDDLNLTHTDVKPANVLVRSRDPYELVIGDFGGTGRNVRRRRDPGGIVVLTTWAYAAPETARGRPDARSAWWALGIIVHELLTRRTPYGNMTPEEVRAALTARRPPPLDAVRDPAWRPLVEGLLTVDPARRWTYEQVAGWVAAENPPPRFQGRTYRAIEDLADDLERHWRAGAVWLADGNGDALADWLVARGTDPASVRHLRAVSAGRAPLALARLAADVLGDLPPRFQGRPVDAAGLLALARGGESGQRLLWEAVDGGILAEAARHRCGHHGCADGCALLRRVHAEAPEVVRRAESRLGWLRDRVLHGYDRAGRRRPAELPSGAEWAALWARATELTLDPDAAGQVHALARAVPPGAAWWDERRSFADPSTLDGRADLAVTALLVRHAWRTAVSQ
ncbi:protein kinase domain-containing protein [Actinomadura rayongensis]|uniref:non-specific serine/threonine protein kinase n=1 Tax=Actinomadura rayongensis TaxID=1429076 RepID=A0A6I4WDB8_9ACTN|nr:protein kinase [Actinomadura rayongensis]